MDRWPLYLYIVVTLALLGLCLDRLALHPPTLLLPLENFHPLVQQAYLLLRGGEVWLYAILGVLLAPFIVGSRRPSVEMIRHRPSSVGIGLASLWHYTVLVAGGTALLYFWHPWTVRLPTNRIDEIVRGWSQLRDAPTALAVNAWWLVLFTLAPPVFYLMLWRNPQALSRFLRNMLLPALLLADGLALFALAGLSDSSWLWAGLAGFFSPVVILWAFLVASFVRQPDKGLQLGGLLLLLILTLPVAAISGLILYTWDTSAIHSQIAWLPTGLPLPSAVELLNWSAVTADLLFLILTGVVCRRAEEHAQQIDALTERLCLSRLTYHLPQRQYGSVKMATPRTGFALVDVPVMVFVTLLESLANAALATVRLLDNLLTTLADWLLHLIYTLAILVYNLAVILLVHLIYTLVNLPRLILDAARYLLDAMDVLARQALVPGLAGGLAGLGLMLTLNAAVSYFLVGQSGLLFWGLWGAAALLLGIVICLSAVSRIGLGDAAAWYLLGLAERLPYPMLILVLLLWALILGGPRMGITHFHAGIVTWTLTGLFAGVTLFGLFFGKKEEPAQSTSLTQWDEPDER